MLEPDVAAALAAMKPPGAPPLPTLPPAVVREAIVQSVAATRGAPQPVGAVADRTIAGPGGALPLRVYTPDAAVPLPAAGWPLVVFFHGGGFVLCNLDTHDDLCRHLCAGLQALVVSVDYRLAPEHRFPAAVDDAQAAAQWAAREAVALGANPARLALAGDSAGATLALAVAQRWAAGPEPALAALLALYPVADMRWPSCHASMQQLGSGAYGLSSDEMRWFGQLYLREAADALHAEVSPLLSPTLDRLPPVTLVLAQADPLHDEGAALGQRLQAAGTLAELIDVPGQVHGFFAMAGVPSAGRAADQVLQRWKRRF